ncbi:MAG TPA: DUF6010 family protein [Vicinamibacteria bacterium]|nr:DUF6010 family protein [Vicinamibacteria bacterium]
MIVVLYVVIGLLAATGCVTVSRRFLGPRAEQVFYAVFLVVIAAFYLAFAAHFRSAMAWRLESAAVVAFFAIGLAGARLPVALVVGYLLHGPWDLLHELVQQGAISAFEPGQLTAVPLAYGFFCAAFDLFMAGYIYQRRGAWAAASHAT